MRTCFEKREKRGEYKQKMYAETFTSHARKTVNQLDAHVYRFEQIWASNELELQFKVTESDLKEGRKKSILLQPS